MNKVVAGAASVVLIAIACVVTNVREPVGSLLVDNSSGAHVSVYIEGRKLGVATGRGSCIHIYAEDLTGIGYHQLTLRPTAEDAFVTPAVNLTGGWRITVGPWPHGRAFDAISLMPAPRCDG